MVFFLKRKDNKIIFGYYPIIKNKKQEMSIKMFFFILFILKVHHKNIYFYVFIFIFFYLLFILTITKWYLTTNVIYIKEG
jgi:hypothetical protein